MEPRDYLIAWILYGVAAVIMSIIAWLLFRRYLWRELAYLLECWLLAIFFTPAKVLVEQEVMAPAIIVFAMDTVTIDPTAGIRALIPLVMAMAGMLVVAVLLSVVYRVRLRRTLQ
ncbi:MAG: hypothetical protein V4628_02900 [Pseudomonadota bacterium]